MTFDVIPAVDVSRGRLARPTPQGVRAVDAFGGDPVLAARSFLEAGARWIHVVDMDLVGTGEFVNLGVMAEIASLGVQVQASGGITTSAQVEAARSAEAGRVVLGSAVFAERAAAEDLIVRFGDGVAVGIEASGDRITPRGGSDDLPLRETIDWLAGVAVLRFVHTSVARVGADAGPDLEGIRALVERTPRPVIAAGGIRGLGDLREVAACGAEAAIVGRALYEGLDLRSVLSALA